MNRIRELRIERGLTGEQLAEIVGTTQGQIHKLESGKRRLTVDWMQRIARALNVTPIELLEAAAIADFVDDVTPYEPADDHLLAAVASTGLQFFEVLTRVLERRGYVPGNILLVDTNTPLSQIDEAGAVIVRTSAHGESAMRLRQFAQPSLLLTNQGGRNDVLDMEHAPVKVELVGAVVRKIERRNGSGR